MAVLVLGSSSLRLEAVLVAMGGITHSTRCCSRVASRAQLELVEQHVGLVVVVVVVVHLHVPHPRSRRLAVEA
jgi:hypothetical protein